MSTATLTSPPTGTTPGGAHQRGTKNAAPIPFARIVSVELRKMFDTRSGFWLMVVIGLAGVVATVAVILFAPADQLAYDSFSGAIGTPMLILLPVMAILAVTGEWSQRTGLATFTYVPHRGRVIAAKAVCAIGVGVVSIALAAGIGAIGNIVGAAIHGTDAVWNMSVLDLLLVTLANVLGLMVGFMLGVLLRSSPGAIVGYFVFQFVIPGLSSVLATSQHWWEQKQPWLDFNFAQGRLYDGSMTTTDWAQLGTTGLIWLVIPLAIGLRLVVRSEVK